MEAKERQVLYYLPTGGQLAPYRVWRDGMKDVRTRAAIDARVGRMRGGNFSDSWPIGEAASEIELISDLGTEFIME